VVGATRTRIAAGHEERLAPRTGEARVIGAGGAFLVVGGRGAGGALLDDVVRFDPAAGELVLESARLSAPRAEAGAALLGDGSVVVAGGVEAEGPALGVERIAGAFSASPASAAVPLLELAPRVAPLVVAVSDLVLLVAGGAPAELEEGSIAARDDAEVLASFGPSTLARFAPDNELSLGRVGGAAIASSEGRVTFVGGSTTRPLRTAQPSIETYALSSNRFEVFGLMGPGTALEVGGVASHPAVVSAGGDDPHGGGASNGVRAYDLVDETFVVAPPLGSARRDHVFVRLGATNAYLVAGGRDATGRVLATATIYDLDEGTDRPLPIGLIHARAGASATTLPSTGRVLICGGQGAGNELLESCELFTPSSNPRNALRDSEMSVEDVGDMAFGRVGHTATLLENDDVLLVGGGDIERDGPSANVFVAATGTLRRTGDAPIRARRRHGAIAIDGTHVVLFGGEVVFGGVSPSGDAEIFDAAGRGGQGSFTAVTAQMPLPRVSPGAARVIGVAGGTELLVFGGATPSALPFPTRALASTERFSLGGGGAFDAVDQPLTFGRADLRVVDVGGRVVVTSGTHRDGLLASGEERLTPLFFVDVLEDE